MTRIESSLPDQYVLNNLEEQILNQNQLTFTTNVANYQENIPTENNLNLILTSTENSTVIPIHSEYEMVIIIVLKISILRCIIFNNNNIFI